MLDDLAGLLDPPPLGEEPPPPILATNPRNPPPFSFFSSFAGFAVGYSPFSPFTFSTLGFEDSDHEADAGLTAASPSSLYSSGGRPFMCISFLSFFYVI